MYSFGDSVKLFFTNYVNFRTRSTRAEFWWVQLFLTAVGLILSFVSQFAGDTLGESLSGLWALAIFLPSLSLTVRRLHDIGKSGWWLLIPYLLAPVMWIAGLIAALAVVSGALTGGVDFSASGSSTILTLIVILLVTLGIQIWFLIWFVTPSAGPNKWGYPQGVAYAPTPPASPVHNVVASGGPATLYAPIAPIAPTPLPQAPVVSANGGYQRPGHGEENIEAQEENRYEAPQPGAALESPFKFGVPQTPGNFPASPPPVPPQAPVAPPAPFNRPTPVAPPPSFPQAPVTPPAPFRQGSITPPPVDVAETPGLPLQEPNINLKRNPFNGGQ